MAWSLVLFVLIPLVLGVSHGRSNRPTKSSRAVIDAGRPTSAFDCDTRKAQEWYGSEKRCREDLCRGANRSNAYVQGPDGRLRANPCDHRLRE
jgi:hypothetical protein